ncbi:MAG: MetQ/NlpA family ABC transporter substrate-binding protein [Negativicutes bacterium]
MVKRKKWLVLVTVATLTAFALTGCGGETKKADTGKPAQPAVRNSIKVGATAGPQAEVLEVAKKVAAKDGLTIQIVEFNDFIQPNVALNQGDLDANIYQHQPFLENQIKERNYELTSIAQTIIIPMGIYSKKIKKLDELKPGSIVAVPNDPTNGGRGLLLLEKAGLIKLNPKAGLKATPQDIVDNPKNLKIKELEAAQVPRSLDDVDIAAVNANYAVVAGLSPKTDSILLEDTKSPYACVIVVRSKDKADPVFQKLVKAYQSPEVKAFVEKQYKGAFVAVW